MKLARFWPMIAVGLGVGLVYVVLAQADSDAVPGSVTKPEAAFAQGDAAGQIAVASQWLGDGAPQEQPHGKDRGTNDREPGKHGANDQAARLAGQVRIVNEDTDAARLARRQIDGRDVLLAVVAPQEYMQR